DDVIGTLSEAEILAYVRRPLTTRDGLLSALGQSPARDAERAYRAVWDTRATALRALTARRNLIGSLPRADQVWQQLAAVRSRLARVSLSVPTPDQVKTRAEQLAQLGAEKERLERELGTLSNAFQQETRKRKLQVSDLVRALPREVAVVELLEVAALQAPAS